MPEPSDENTEPNAQLLDELRSRTDALEERYRQLCDMSDARLIRAEIKAEALRAGMIDLDCLQFLDLSGLAVNEKGEVHDASAAIARLKKSKPWIFSSPSSSSLATAPLAQPLRQKHATEMTDNEYAAARAALLKNRY